MYSSCLCRFGRCSCGVDSFSIEQMFEKLAITGFLLHGLWLFKYLSEGIAGALVSIAGYALTGWGAVSRTSASIPAGCARVSTTIIAFANFAPQRPPLTTWIRAVRSPSTPCWTAAHQCTEATTLEETLGEHSASDTAPGVAAQATASCGGPPWPWAGRCDHRPAAHIPRAGRPQ